MTDVNQPPIEVTGDKRQRNSDLPTVEILLEPDSRAQTEAHSAIDTRPRQAQQTCAPSSTHQRSGRLLRIVAAVVAATILSAAVTHRYDQSSRPATPPWIQACRAAIEANAELQRVRSIELDEAMQYAWALAAGMHVQPQPLDTSSTALLQRDADNKTRDCISPTDPAQNR